MTKNSFVLDTSAIIESMKNSDRGKRVDERIAGGTYYVTPETVSEATSKAFRNGDDHVLILRRILDSCIVVETRAELGYDTGMYHAIIRKRKPKFSYGDAAVVAAATSLGATIITCDDDFSIVKNAIVVK